MNVYREKNREIVNSEKGIREKDPQVTKADDFYSAHMPKPGYTLCNF